METKELSEAEVTFVSWGEDGEFAYVPEIELRAHLNGDEWAIWISRDEEHGGWHIYRLEHGAQVWEEGTAPDQFQVLFGANAMLDEADLDRLLVALQDGGENGWRKELELKGGLGAVKIVQRAVETGT